MHARFRVGDCAFNFTDNRIGIVQNRDKRFDVCVRLAHFFSRLLQRHNLCTGFADKGFGQREGFTVKTIETVRNIAGNFQMLLLVHADRHVVCLIQQNIRRHQHRISKQTDVDVFRVFLTFIFKLCHTCRFPELRVAVENPAELCVCADVALHKNGVFLGVKADGKQKCIHFQRLAAKLCGFRPNGNRMQVRNGIITFIVIRHIFPVLQRTEIVAECGRARRLNCA